MEQKTKHPHNGHRQRLKSKALEGGIEHWPSHEVLELILTYAIPRKDVNPLAHELLNTFGSIANVLDVGYEQLIKVKGVTHESALFMSLLPDMFSRYTASKNVDSFIMDDGGKCASYYRTIDRVKNVEEFYVFCLGSNKKLIKTIKMETGLSSAVGVSKTVFAQQIAFEANKSIMILHTHPNGNPLPTQTDIDSTKALINATNALGIKLDDHVIVTNNSYYSFVSSGLLGDIMKDLEINGYKENKKITI